MRFGARFATHESTLTAPNCRVKNFILRTHLWRPKIATPGKALRASHYWVANFKLDKINIEFKLENRKKYIKHCKIRYSLNMQK